ncbi:Pumilio-like protein 1 [Dichanthelium oligosanthes]|uniref:Pumilio-like protein 1 n=1 Tax=Dichanthelium oligosanthes TaxID=888268 RepID=A0A1E5WCZ8_9POAL|nr:Pumilio-like protein 1 [Dichanthelium oligosanthes]
MDPQDHNAKEITGLNAQDKMSNGENIVHASGPFSGAQSSDGPGNVEQDSKATLLKRNEDLIAFQMVYIRTCNDPNETTSRSVLQQDMNNYFSRDALIAYFGDNSAHTDTTVIPQQRASYCSSQVQQFEGVLDNVHAYASGFNNMVPYVELRQQQMGTPVNTTTFRIMHIRGQVAAFCADGNGSRFIQQAIEVATTGEIIMVYEEIMPYVCVLAANIFGNHALQKAFELGEDDQKVVMAKELSSKVLKCVRDKYANYVIQKCIECLPSKNGKLIFRSFYSKAMELSIHVHRCHVVQHLLEHRSPLQRSMMVNKFAGRIMSMSYDKFTSNVIENCLTFGCNNDQQLITNEIIVAGGGQHFDHIKDMMMDPYANSVIQKMVVTAEEWQLGVLMDVGQEQRVQPAEVLEKVEGMTKAGHRNHQEMPHD